MKLIIISTIKFDNYMWWFSFIKHFIESKTIEISDDLYKDTKNCNEIIVKKLGYEYISSDKSFDMWGWWKKGTYNGDATSDIKNLLCPNSAYLAYNKSYDSLYEVVDFLEKDPNVNLSVINSNHSYLVTFDNKIYFSHTIRLMAIWMACVYYCNK